LDTIVRVKAYVAVTDGDWHSHLRARPDIDEVNFWQPGGKTRFKALEPGELFLFKPHRKHVVIGGGVFGYSTLMPLYLAWDAFGQANGAASIQQMRERIRKYREQEAGPNPTIGCIMIQQPFFLDEPDWIPLPDWKPNIVQGKTYDLTSGVGACIQAGLQPKQRYHHIQLEPERRGYRYLAFGRFGQGTFRALVLDAYRRRCAVTGERTLPAVEAAHIQPYGEGGEHRITNGLALRRDIHSLFDEGYVTITPEFRFRVSRRIREEFENGREYYALDGRILLPPSRPEYSPDRDLLLRHNREKFLA
jgi:putative restriction endonuclease